MKILTKVSEVRAYRRGLSGPVGLVPTMGFLHQGHLSLVAASKKECAQTCLSLFVNPTQFGPNEDFERYPRDFERDRALCEQAGVDCLFCPEVTEMYSGTALTSVEVERLTKKLCGLSRPTHFKGVTTVVTKLFNIVQPDLAFFGQKDLQQCLVIKKMAADLDMPLEIRVCPIIRETDGLALSSRNKYLTPEEREIAPVLFQSLQAAEKLFRSGERRAQVIKTEMLKLLNRRVTEAVGKVDYLEIVSITDLAGVETLGPGTAIVLAVFIGKTRLIDNILIEPFGS